MGIAAFKYDPIGESSPYSTPAHLEGIEENDIPKSLALNFNQGYKIPFKLTGSSEKRQDIALRRRHKDLFKPKNPTEGQMAEIVTDYFFSELVYFYTVIPSDKRQVLMEDFKNKHRIGDGLSSLEEIHGVLSLLISAIPERKLRREYKKHKKNSEDELMKASGNKRSLNLEKKKAYKNSHGFLPFELFKEPVVSKPFSEYKDVDPAVIRSFTDELREKLDDDGKEYPEKNIPFIYRTNPDKFKQAPLFRQPFY